MEGTLSLTTTEARDKAIYKTYKEGKLPFRKVAEIFNVSPTKAFNIVVNIDSQKINERMQANTETGLMRRKS